MSHVWLMARSEQLRQLVVQLASQASLEDVVTHGLQSLLEWPPGSSRQSHQWISFCPPRFCGLDPVLPCLKLLLVALGSPFCSVNVGPLVCPSRAAPRLFPTARSPPTAGLAPRPLPLALGARPM